LENQLAPEEPTVLAAEAAEEREALVVSRRPGVHV
jgi:hypothetical protein